MKTWQRILVYTLLIVSALGIAGVIAFVVPPRGDRICEEIHLSVSDFDEYRFVTTAGIEQHLKSKGLYPIGTPLSEIDLSEIETSIGEISLIKEAVSYFDSQGNLNISVTQRVPLFRVKTANGDFYVDTDRKRMPTSRRYTAHVPLVTGNVHPEFATAELFDFMLYLSGESRWATAFTQVYVYPNNEVELVPRVGNFIIEMGDLSRYPQKLYKLDVFLDKIPKYKPWDAYSSINLKYKDKVVCTPLKSGDNKQADTTKTKTDTTKTNDYGTEYICSGRPGREQNPYDGCHAKQRGQAPHNKFRAG